MYKCICVCLHAFSIMPPYTSRLHTFPSLLVSGFLLSFQLYRLVRKASLGPRLKGQVTVSVYAGQKQFVSDRRQEPFGLDSFCHGHFIGSGFLPVNILLSHLLSTTLFIFVSSLGLQLHQAFKVCLSIYISVLAIKQQKYIRMYIYT